MGLYKLNRRKEYRSEWIFILDITIEIGKTKCLVILGIPQEKLAIIIKEEARSLQHNIDILISWAIKIISYEENQDFSAIDNTCILDKEEYRLLKSSISTDTIKILKKPNRKLLRILMNSVKLYQRY